MDSLDKVAKAFNITVSDLLRFERKREGKTKEEIFQELSKGELEVVRKAMQILEKIFR